MDLIDAEEVVRICSTNISSDIRKKPSEQFFLQQIRNNLPYSRAFSWRGDIVVLLKLPGLEQQTYREYLMARLHPLFSGASQQNFKACISRPFETIGHFADAYRQAAGTKRIAEEENAEDIYSFFDDCWIQDLIDGNPVAEKQQFYCEYCVMHLARQQTQKAAQQLKILYEYLNNDRNFTNVAQKLNMHRNNVIYHIHNIESRYHLDLNDSRTRLKLLISFEILKENFKKRLDKKMYK